MKKDIFLSILSSLLLILSFPNYNLWILTWVGFVPLFFALINKTKLRAFFLAYLTGVIFWSGIIYWLVHVTLPGTILLILYLALYFGIFGLVISQSYLLPTTYYLLLVPSSWVLLEYLRSHLFTGFPWALLGYSQYLNLSIIQISDITGVWGVSFLVMMVNVFIYQVIGHRSWVVGKKQKPSIHKIYYILPSIFLLLSLSYGYYHLNLPPTTYHLPPIKISVIQGNIPQELKWDSKNNDFVVDKYINLTVQAAKDKPDLIIWPEAAMPCVLGGEQDPCYREYEKINKFIKEISIPLLLGAVNVSGDFLSSNYYYNSALLISTEGKLLEEYHKIHLVPFGEYIPLKKILPFLETVVPIGDITPGRDYTIFTQGAIRFSVLICFEDLFPELSRQFVRRGAQFLVNITNDAWYKKSSAPFQHLQASVFRAVENRVFLVRAANTGVSGFILPTGKIISLVQDESSRKIFVDGFATQDIFMPERPRSFYTRYGDVFIIVCFLVVIPMRVWNAFQTRIGIGF